MIERLCVALLLEEHTGDPVFGDTELILIICLLGEAELFLTHRVFVIDGSSFSMPDTPPLQQEFGHSPNQKAGCGFPVAHLLALFDASELTKYLTDEELPPAAEEKP